MKAVEDSDLIIITTPTYCLAPTASLKALIDLTFTYWLPHRPREFMFSKKAVILSTAAGNGARKAVKQVKEALFYWGIPWIKGYGINIQAMEWKGVSEKNQKKIEKDISGLAQKLNQNRKVRVGLKSKAMFSMMRMMQSNGWGSSDYEKIYWEEKGWLGKKRPWK